MNNSLIFTFILIALCSCKKDKTEYVNHDSAIFFDDDTLFIGKWEYLYTWNGGGYIGISKKTIENVHSIDIKQKGNYEKFHDGIVLHTGKIDTLFQ